MKTNKIVVLGAISAFLFSACQDLDLHYQGGTLDEEQVTAAVEAIPDRVNSSISGMYAILNKPYVYFGLTNVTYGRADDFGYPCAALGQDLNSGDMVSIVSDNNWFKVALEWSDRNPNYANPQIRLGLFYKVIYAANDALAAIPEGEIQNDALRAKRGQARAIRAWAYLSLAPYFQFKYVGNEDKPCVPIVTGAAGEDTRNNPRASVKDVYELIMTDINGAIDDLKGFTRENKGIIDRNVAFGLRARVNLNMENWKAAADDADSAMVGYTPYTKNEIETGTPGFYNASDHNWIWALLLPQELIGDELASWPSQLGSFSGNAYVPYAGIYRSINKILWDLIPETDVRKGWWLDADLHSPYLEGLVWKDPDTSTDSKEQDIAKASIPDVKEPFNAYANVKFGQRAGIGSAYNDGDWCMMRAEEMIFIKAEGLAKSGSLAEGKALLEDFVKTNRDPNYTCTATDVDAFSDAVWLQRRIELWGEGFAMSDVMRLGKPVVRVVEGKESNYPEVYQFNIAPDDPWMLLRFVQRETSNNAGLVNNEGGTAPKQGDGKDLRDGVTD